MSILGKMTVGFRNILVVNSEKKMPICFRSVNVFVMCASCRNAIMKDFFSFLYQVVTIFKNVSF